MARALNILIVEDDRGDAQLQRIALEEQSFHCNVHTVECGCDALAFLRRQGAFGDVLDVDLVLLDGSLPDMSGAEVLAAIKAEPHLQALPIVVVTGHSDRTTDQEFLSVGAEMVLSKENDFDALARKFSLLQKYA